MKKNFEIAPGVLSGEQLQLLAEGGHIGARGETDVGREYDASAFDLRLSPEAWRLNDGQRPTTRALSKIQAAGEPIHPQTDSNGDFFEFKRGEIYLVKLDEFLDLPPNISGRATGKSSVGRLDVITRLITADCLEYDLVRSGYKGELHLLIAPQTFSIRVSPGASLNQLRLFCGPQHRVVIGRDLVQHYGTPFWFLQDEHGQYREWDLEGFDLATVEPTLFDLTVELGDPDEAFVYRARKDVEPALDLRRPFKGTFDPKEYFERVEVVQTRGDSHVILDKGAFYIMKSRERLNIPQDVAVEVIAISERIGDIRIHYAGFAHPGFGRARTDGRRGTPLIFEVRATDFTTRLSSGSILARIQLFRMSRSVVPEEVQSSDYEQQELKLSSVFGDWVS